MSLPTSPRRLDEIEVAIDAWAAGQVADNDVVEAVERDTESGERRWFVRVRGEEKSVFSVWFHLRQRNLHVETYVLPAPEENHARFYEYLLRRNRHLGGFSFAIGEEDAVFLVAEVPNEWIDEDRLDHLLGGAYAHVEQSFRPALRIGFASRLGSG